VKLHRLVADPEQARDGFVGQAIGNKLEHLRFTWRQRFNQPVFVLGSGNQQHIRIRGRRGRSSRAQGRSFSDDGDLTR